MFPDDAKQFLRPVEFNVPISLVRMAGRCGIVRNPYSPADHKLRAIFIHIPKVAGTSIRRAIFDEPARNIPAIRYAAFDRCAFDQYFKFAFVRNPWQRFSSAFYYLWRRRNASPDFEDHRWARHYLCSIGDISQFVQKMMNDRRYRNAVLRYIHFLPQIYWISVLRKGKREIAVDFVGRHENLSNDFRKICKILGVDAELEWLRKGDIVDHSTTLSTKMLDFVGEIYKCDIDAFGYRKPQV